MRFIFGLLSAVFGATIYFPLFNKITFEGEWTELLVVGIKTALASLSAFIGRMLTIGAIAEMTARNTMKKLEV